MKLKSIKTASVIFTFMFIHCVSFAQDEILGVWLTQDKEAKIKFYEKGDKYFGKIIWLKTPFDAQGNQMSDVNNPEKALKKRELTGLITLTNFTYVDNEWTNGTIYDPTDGGTYDCKMWIENNNILKVRGYLGFLYETETWTKSKL